MKFALLATGKAKLFALGLGTVAVTTMTVGSMLSMALFTDTETDDSTFTTGTIVLDAAKIDSMDLTVTALMPGSSVSSGVAVENDGTAELRYAVSQTSTAAPLANQLLLVIREDDADGGCDDADGTIIRASAALGTSGNLVGSPTQGAQAGDRTLAATASEELCFYVSLPLSADNTAQGLSTTTTFTFAAEQTANNP